MKNIYLVGFMATGKSSVGRELARRLNRQYWDMDGIIEQREKMPIVEIFRRKGEAYFRQLEKELVKQISQQTDLVVSCGGGAIVNKENLANFRKSGVIICLNADVETILKRTEDDGNRPLLNVKDKKHQISRLLNKRMPFYNQSDHIIDTSNLTVNQVVDKIIFLLGDKNN